ncbi:adenylate/guanylate cyclase domain-containing protein [Microcoleus sp. Pol7_A1]|uniref:adenylate/guanylate cyclase domain-containing protein n=1 Tax=Microcoleus sp. Pol7_A1 TaxID=2818893 RepID=UPI002FD726D5
MPNESDEFDELLKNFHGEEKEVSILFVNLYGVERLTQHMEVEARVELFHHYFQVMVETVFEHQGTVDKYIGSTIMVVFKSPMPLEDHALMAIKAALAMRERLPEINSAWFPEAQHPLSIGIGINTDRVFCGNVGSPQRMEFTVVGHGVNVANHLSQQTQQYGGDILIGQKTYESCAEYVQVRERDSTQLKPEGNPFKVYELIGLNA